MHETVVQHDEDEDCNDEGIEEAREALATGGMEELLAGLGSNDDANLLDIGNGNDPVAAAASGQPPANLGDLLGGGGTGGQSLPSSATQNESEAGATANLLGL